MRQFSEAESLDAPQKSLRNLAHPLLDSVKSLVDSCSCSKARLHVIHEKSVELRLQCEFSCFRFCSELHSL